MLRCNGFPQLYVQEEDNCCGVAWCCQNCGKTGGGVVRMMEALAIAGVVVTVKSRAMQIKYRQSAGLFCFDFLD